MTKHYFYRILFKAAPDRSWEILGYERSDKRSRALAKARRKLQASYGLEIHPNQEWRAELANNYAGVDGRQQTISGQA